jgi:hypothetical protein
MGARSTAERPALVTCDPDGDRRCVIAAQSVNRLFTLWRVEDLDRFSVIEIQRVAVFGWRVSLKGMTCRAPKVEDLQFTTDHHCRLSICRCQSLEIKFHNKCFASDSTIARSRSTMTGAKASASSASE